MEDSQKHIHDSNIRIPQNIMIKSAYNLYQITESSYHTETINEICNFIAQYEQSELDSIEIEAKLGYFEFTGAHVKCYKDIKDTFKLPIYDRSQKNFYHYIYDFKSGLNENQFYSLWYFITKEAERHGSEITQLAPLNYKETFYQSGTRRSLLYEKGVPVKEEIIQKKEKNHINIRNKGNDFRITACREEKQHGISSDDTPKGYREKFRISYKFRFFRLDFTIVSSYKDLDISSPKTISYEVEFEIDELKKCLSTGDEFPRILLRFIQNIFCFYQVMSPEFYNTRFRRPRFKGDSLYGDYLEKHLAYEKLVEPSLSDKNKK